MALSEALSPPVVGTAFMGNRERQQPGDAASAKGFWKDNGVDQKKGHVQAKRIEDPQRLLPALGTSLSHTRMESSARGWWQGQTQPQPSAVQP